MPRVCRLSLDHYVASTHTHTDAHVHMIVYRRWGIYSVVVLRHLNRVCCSTTLEVAASVPLCIFRRSALNSSRGVFIVE